MEIRESYRNGREITSNEVILNFEDKALSSYIYANNFQEISLGTKELEKVFLRTALSYDNLVSLSNIYLRYLEKSNTEKFKELEKGKGEEKGFDLDDVLSALSKDLLSNYRETAFVLFAFERYNETKYLKTNPLKEILERPYIQDFFKGLKLSAAERKLFVLAVAHEDWGWLFPDFKNDEYKANLFCHICSINKKDKLGYVRKLNSLLKICEDGSLLYHDGSEVRVKYCNDCKKFYFGKRIRREDDKCPVCNGKSIKYLSNSSRLPGWFGEESASLIDKDEADMRLDTCDSEKVGEIRKCIEKLQGKSSYITMDEQKREKIIELGKRYPNMQEVVDYILTSLESSSLRKHKEISLRPFVLVGGPGCGKTSFVTELGLILLGEKALKIDLGNDLPAFTIAGGDPQYRQSKHGLIIESMFKNDKHGPLKNPLIHFDELDKIHPDENYSIETVFYSILENNTARRFYDAFIALNVDASGINYVFTANSLENIPKPILNRLRIFQIPDYTHEQLKEIVIDNFYKNWLKNNDMEQEFLPEVLSEEIKDQILNECHDDPRSIDDAITMIFTRTLTIDRESGHKIALFSPKEYYLGWKHFRGKRRISKKSWRLPENFIKPPVLDLFAEN